MDILNRISSYISEDIASPKNIKEEVYNFLRNNPSPSYDDILYLADQLNITVDELNHVAWKFLGSFCGYGYFNESGKSEYEFDPEELTKGIEIEMEHTNDEFMSKRIALDHLAEIGNYYTLLIDMEKSAGVED